MLCSGTCANENFSDNGHSLLQAMNIVTKHPDQGDHHSIRGDSGRGGKDGCEGNGYGFINQRLVQPIQTVETTLASSRSPALELRSSPSKYSGNIREVLTKTDNTMNSTRTSPSAVQNEVSVLLPICLRQLHDRISRTLPISRPCSDSQDILTLLCEEGLSHQLAKAITRFLLNLNGSHKTGLRCSIVYPLGHDDVFWVIAEWKEDNDIEVITIFHIDDEDEPSFRSWMMHRGYGDRPWRKTSISWSVINIEHLRQLFEATQHIMGILELPTADALRLYCEVNPNDCSKEAITRYTELLLHHLLKIEKVNRAFDELAPLLEKFSSKQCIPPRGRKRSLFDSISGREGEQDLEIASDTDFSNVRSSDIWVTMRGLC